MSTSYYYLRKPIGKIAIKRSDDDACVFDLLEDSGEVICNLVIRSKYVPEFLFMLADRDDIMEPMYTRWGGKRVGCVVTENFRGLDPELQLISGEGELLTVNQIRAMAGSGKED